VCVITLVAAAGMAGSPRWSTNGRSCVPAAGSGCGRYSGRPA